jgi:F420-non-reducing hydrogenase iron-sulfur subunit
VDYLHKLLEQIGMQPDRVRMYYLSAAMASQFAEAAREMTEQIESLGRNPLRNHPEPKDEPGE